MEIGLTNASKMIMFASLTTSDYTQNKTIDLLLQIDVYFKIGPNCTVNTAIKKKKSKQNFFFCSIYFFSM